MFCVRKIKLYYNLSYFYISAKFKNVSKAGKLLISNTRMYNTASSQDYVFIIEKEEAVFRKSLSKTIDSLLQNSLYKKIPEVDKWLEKIMRENLIGGKNRRGFSTVMAYGMTEEPGKINEKTLNLARTLGWCVEMFQAYGVILDDIMDGSTSRRGNPCWYKRPEVGLSCAINDSILLYNNMLHILKINFNKAPTYVDKFHLITETMCLTAGGQYLDYITAKDPRDYSTFTAERYNDIVKYKTAYYTYNLPVNLGLLLTSNIDAKMFGPINDICLKLGKLFQMQDDYIDLYSDETLSGKLGTDIQERKCTWLAVQALQRCTDKQRKVFEICYGSSEPAHIERVKRLYDELELPKLYSAEEEALYEDILEKIRSIPLITIRTLLEALLKITYKRQF